MSSYPQEFRYTKEHEWIKTDGAIAAIGITFHAQEELGDIVYLDLPQVGARVEMGKPLGSIESVKAVSDIFSPISGEVTEVNPLLTTAPEKLNQDPHGGAWLIKVRLTRPEEMSQLLSAADYESYIGVENE